MTCTTPRRELQTSDANSTPTPRTTDGAAATNVAAAPTPAPTPAPDAPAPKEPPSGPPSGPAAAAVEEWVAVVERTRPAVTKAAATNLKTGVSMGGYGLLLWYYGGNGAGETCGLT